MEIEDPPKRLGICTNPINLVVVHGEMVPIPCNRAIFEDDIEMVELPDNKFCCAKCVEGLLAIAVVSQTDPQPPKRSHKKKYDGASVDGRARLPKGEKL